MKNEYVHGYMDRESIRLTDQASCLGELLHNDTVFPKKSLILEAGCGVGAQTVIFAPKNPGSKIISIDISEESLKKARNAVKSLNINNVEFQPGDILNLHYPDEYFDHALICFVLEHLPEPLKALKSVKRVLKKGGSITLIEGDHGSAYFYPYSKYAEEAINAQVKLQSGLGGNALIGRQLYPLLLNSSYKNCRVSPRVVYVDSSKPDLVEGFTKNTFTAMIEGIRDKAVENSIIARDTIDKGIEDLYRTSWKDGVFCYTFFKGTGYKL